MLKKLKKRVKMIILNGAYGVAAALESVALPARVRIPLGTHLENLFRRHTKVGFPPEADQPLAEDFQVPRRWRGERNCNLA